MSHESPIRLRRLRRTARLREMLADTRLAPSDFVAPMFIRSGKGVKKPISSMPGVFQWSADTAVEELKRLDSLGVGGYILFGVTDLEKKDAVGSHAHHPENEVCRTLKMAKDAGVGMVAMTDLCYCEYTDHGHCGPLDAQGSVINDVTVDRLGQQAVVHAKAGADIVAPSGMMDGMVRGIRRSLDEAGQGDTAILSYAVKYASSFYGPFREAAESPPQFGDRKGYQMDFRRKNEALREAMVDIAEGSDLIMVKPGLPYLDVLRDIFFEINREKAGVPVGIYQVSGEYSMIKGGVLQNFIDEKGVVLEIMHSFKRAGASFILSYYAGQVAEWVS